MPAFEGLPPPRYLSVGGKPVQTVLLEQNGNSRTWGYELLSDRSKRKIHRRKMGKHTKPTKVCSCCHKPVR